MVLQQKELFSGVTRLPSKRMAAVHAAPKEFATAAGGPTLLVGTPVSKDATTNKWVVWTQGVTPPGTILKIHGFLYFQSNVLGVTVVTPNVDPAVGTVTEGIVLSATEEVHGVVMTHGMIHYADIVLPAGNSQANLDIALRDIDLLKSIVVQGMTGL